MNRFLTTLGIAASVLACGVVHADTIDVGPNIDQVSAKPGDTLHFHGAYTANVNYITGSEYFELYLKAPGTSWEYGGSDSLAKISTATKTNYAVENASSGQPVITGVVSEYDFLYTLSLATGRSRYMLDWSNGALNSAGGVVHRVIVDVAGDAPTTLLKELKNTNATPCAAVVAQIKPRDTLSNIEDLLGKPDAFVVKNDTYTKQITYSCQDGKVDVFFNLKENETHIGIEK